MVHVPLNCIAEHFWLCFSPSLVNILQQWIRLDTLPIDVVVPGNTPNKNFRDTDLSCEFLEEFSGAYILIRRTTESYVAANQHPIYLAEISGRSLNIEQKLIAQIAIDVIPSTAPASEVYVRQMQKDKVLLDHRFPPTGIPGYIP